MSNTSLPQFTPETTVGEIVAAQPALARVFEKLRIDYCCGGRQSLASACAARRLSPFEVLVLLEAAAAIPADGAQEVDAAGMTLTELADHIENTHHVYVREELPRLLEFSERLARKHGDSDPRLLEVASIVQGLTVEMFSHMQKEELVLFPLVRQIDSGVAGGFHCGSIANPIRVMEAEHESAGAAVAKLRELTDGFQAGPEACNTHRALLAGLAGFEADLHRHVHKENSILFPRALARAEAP